MTNGALRQLALAAKERWQGYANGAPDSRFESGYHWTKTLADEQIAVADAVLALLDRVEELEDDAAFNAIPKTDR
jgi:hypothetical protein